MSNVLKGSISDKKADQNLMKIYGLQSIDGDSTESLNFNYPEFDDGQDLFKPRITVLST
jgi:hypothetical protein